MVKVTKADLPEGTRRLHGEVLNTKKKAKAVDRSQAERDRFYAEIGRLYANGEKVADELLAKVRVHAKNRFKPAGKAPSQFETHTVSVESPYAHGVDRVHRVTDTLSAMFKRKQLSKSEYEAGVRIQDAFATLYSVMGGVMDFDRVRGGSLPGSPPGTPQMAASELLRVVMAKLYPDDWNVVARVCGYGFSIEQTAEAVYGAPTSRGERDDIGRRLKEGLRQMADRWFPRERSEQGGGMRFMRSEKATASDIATTAPGRTAHATKDRVYRSGGGA